MTASEGLIRQGHRLIQVGVALFLFTAFEGFAISYFPVPHLGRSVHTLSAYTGILLVALGLVWPRLKLKAGSARVAFWFLLFSSLATISAFLLAALWGVGGSIMPIAAQGAEGTELQERIMQAVIYPAAPTSIVAFTLILWGLRGAGER